jgi:hypothetical protein
METLTLHSHVLAAMSMGFSDRRKDLRGFFFDGEKHRLMTTDGVMMLLYRLPATFRGRYCVADSLAAFLEPGDIELDFRDHGVIRSQGTDERISYMDDHDMWDRLEYSLPNTKPTREPAQFDLNLLLRVQAAAQTIMGGEVEPPIHIHHTGENATWVTTPWLDNFAAVVMPVRGQDYDERMMQW